MKKSSKKSPARNSSKNGVSPRIKNDSPRAISSDQNGEDDDTDFKDSALGETEEQFTEASVNELELANR